MNDSLSPRGPCRRDESCTDAGRAPRPRAPRWTRPAALLCAVAMCLPVACASPVATDARHGTAIAGPGPTGPRADSGAGHAARFTRHAVAADHALASAAGHEILAIGGNAVDAAVATSFALAVVRSASCGIGGGGFMLIHLPGNDRTPARQIALDYRERAPGAVRADHYARLDDPLASRYGVHAVGVPGTVAGLLHALKRWGSLPREIVMAPAIRLAREGWDADAFDAQTARDLERQFESSPGLLEGASFIRSTLLAGGTIRAGDRLRNPQLAGTLEHIADTGADAFYAGAIAESMVEYVSTRGGPLTRDDLAAYAPTERIPLRGTFGDVDIVTMPPPSSGGIVLLEVLGLLERRGRGSRPPAAGTGTPEYRTLSAHRMVEALKHAFADRATFLADPDFVEVPVASMLAPGRLDDLARRIEDATTHAAGSYGPGAAPLDDHGTSHFCVIDSGGMAVACTETINLPFGALIAVPALGFPLNNQMDDFATRPGEPNAFGLIQSDRNAPAPGKRPLSSMSPTIVLKNGEVVAIVGASGGPRIITGTLQVLLRVLVDRMGASDAVEAPRLHHQWLPDQVEFDARWSDADVRAGLSARGHALHDRDDVGHVQCITVHMRGGERILEAACDSRKGGRPAGR